jgi:hypothetical protein
VGLLSKLAHGSGDYIVLQTEASRSRFNSLANIRRFSIE